MIRPTVVVTGILWLWAATSFGQSQKTLTLREAQAIALANHPQISEARLLASAASQAVTEVRSAFFPNFFASVTGADAVENSRIAAGGLNNPIIYSRFGSGLTMSQLITDFGRTANLASSSRLHASAEAQNAEATREQVLLLVDRAFYSALRSQAVLRVAEQTVAARQLIVDQVTALAKSRLKSSLDVSFANVNLSDAKLLLLEAQNDMKAAFAELATAMGSRDQQSFALLDEPMPELLPSDVSPLINQAFRSRPELAGQQFERDAAFKLAEAEKDLWRPSISTVTSLRTPDAGRGFRSNPD
jgi:outer membrane protein